MRTGSCNDHEPIPPTMAGHTREDRNRKMSINTNPSRGFRQRWWVDGLYEDENGYYGFDGQVDAETFGAASAGVGRNHAPALLCDLYYGGSLNLEAHPSVVADAWSVAEHPERGMEACLWVKLFRSAGYTHDGLPAAPPTQPITVYRGCTPDGLKGMSWTSDLAVARTFAHGRLRGRALGRVYALDIAPDKLLAYIHETGRNESEYVIDMTLVLDGQVRLVEE